MVFLDCTPISNGNGGEGRFRCAQDYTAALKSKHEFFLLSYITTTHSSNDDDDDDTTATTNIRATGYIHYHFYWYRAGYRATSATPLITEVVLHISHVVTTSSSAPTPTPLLLARAEHRTGVLLTSLALEHARRMYLGYGMVDVPPGMVGYFQRFFRMTPLPRAAAGDGDDVVPMAIDLSKCSHRYAVLQPRMRRQQPQQQQQRSGVDAVQREECVRQRMIIASARCFCSSIPTMTVAAGCHPHSSISSRSTCGGTTPSNTKSIFIDDNNNS